MLVDGQPFLMLGAQASNSSNYPSNGWYTARYIDEIAAAGQAVLDPPMYCNAALSQAFAYPGEGGGASGGPDWQLIDVWKAAAPHLDFLAADIYERNPKSYAE